MQLVVGFKSFVIHIAEEQSVFVSNSEFRWQCASYAMDLGSGGNVRQWTCYGEPGGSVDFRSSWELGWSDQEQVATNLEGRQMKEHEGPALALSKVQDADVDKGRFINYTQNEAAALLMTRSSVGIGMDKDVGEKSKSQTTCFSVSGGSLSANDEGRPITEFIGPDQNVNEIHLEVVLNVGTEAKGDTGGAQGHKNSGRQGGEDGDSAGTIGGINPRKRGKPPKRKVVRKVVVLAVARTLGKSTVVLESCRAAVADLLAIKVKAHVDIDDAHDHLSPRKLLQLVTDRPKTNVHIDSHMGPGVELEVHCWSSDDDCGVKKIEDGESYSFRFRPNVWGITKFECSLQWQGGTVTDSFYVYFRDIHRCHRNCEWIANTTAVYGVSWNSDISDIVFPWQKSAASK
ncbi:hypothetical protein Dimus_001743 [Dionaea muscipula]